MAIVRRTIQKLGQLNFFANAETIRQDDEQVLHDQILSTRVYIILMITSICILLISVSLVQNTSSRMVSKPSIDTYERLQAAYSTTLVCRCQEIAVLYSTFLSITPTYHQVKNFIRFISWRNSRWISATRLVASVHLMTLIRGEVLCD